MRVQIRFSCAPSAHSALLSIRVGRVLWASARELPPLPPRHTNSADCGPSQELIAGKCYDVCADSLMTRNTTTMKCGEWLLAQQRGPQPGASQRPGVARCAQAQVGPPGVDASQTPCSGAPPCSQQHSNELGSVLPCAPAC